MIVIPQNALKFFPDEGISGVLYPRQTSRKGHFIANVEHRISGPGLKTFLGADVEFLYAPAGFRTDFASFPRWMWSLYHPMGPWARAAFWHDVVFRLLQEQFSMEQANLLFWLIMNHDQMGVDEQGNSVEVIKKRHRVSFTAALWICGESAWKKNGGKEIEVLEDARSNRKRLHSQGLLIERGAA